MAFSASQIKPYKSSLTNKLEFFNEACTFLVAYHLLVQTDHFIPDMETKNGVSISLITLTIVISVLNMSLVIGVSLREGLTRLKYKLIRQEQIEEA